MISENVTRDDIVSFALQVGKITLSQAIKLYDIYDDNRIIDELNKIILENETK